MASSKMELTIKLLRQEMSLGGNVIAQSSNISGNGEISEARINEPDAIASIAIFEAVELLRFEEASLYSALLLGVSFLILLLVYSLGFRKNNALRW